MRGGGGFLAELRGGLLGGGELGRELRLLGPELRDALLAGGEVGAGGGEFFREPFAGRLLVGEGVAHRGDEILVLRGGVGVEFGHGRLLGARRLRLLPAREREEIQEEKIAEDEQQRLVHDTILASAWLSMMSARRMGRTWRIFTSATQVMPKRLEE